MDVKVTITRTNHDKIRIYLTDELSRVEFVQLEMDPAEFALALTGLAAQPSNCTVHGLEYVGKRKVREPRSIECPLPGYQGKDKLQQWLLDNAQEEGWTIDPYLGSQTSVSYHSGAEGGVTLRYSVYKYIDVEEDTEEEEP